MTRTNDFHRAVEEDTPLVLELVPPPLARGRNALAARADEAARIHDAVGLTAVNIPEIREEHGRDPRGRRRMPFVPRFEPRELAREIRRRAGLPSIVNRVVVHESESAQAEWFRRTHDEYGVSRFVLVGGDDSRRRYPGPSVLRANQLIRECLPDAALGVGNICIPHRQGEARRLIRKARAGADFFTTQVCYQADDITTLLNAVQGGFGDRCVPRLFVSFAPVRTEHNVRFLRWLGVHLSRELEDWLCADGATIESRSLLRIAEVWEELRGGIPPGQPMGATLAPIGCIRPETIVELARRLQRSNQPLPRPAPSSRLRQRRLKATGLSRRPRG